MVVCDSVRNSHGGFDLSGKINKNQMRSFVQSMEKSSVNA
jgi:hypothetical protein